MRMVFQNPALAWGVLAAAIPVLIHLFFRRRPRPTPFPALDFILKARRETQRRLRLRKLLLYTARTLLLAAAALALARPRFIHPDEAAAAAPRGPSAVAVVLDASASMEYRLGGRTLFERARADAEEALSSLAPEEPATVLVCAGPEVPAAAPPSFDKGELRRLLRGAEQGHGHADLTACIGAAARALSESAPGATLGRKIVVATDLTATAWRLEAPPPTVSTPEGPVRPEVTVLDAARGAPLPNAALVDLAADPDPAVGPRGYRITATVANRADKPLSDAALQLKVGVGPGAQTPIRAFADAPASGTARKTLSYNFPAGGPALVTVALPGDALPVDDARSLTLVIPREVKALVVDGAPSTVRYRDEAYFVEAALSSPASPVRATLIDAETLEKARFADFDVVFLLNVRSLGGRVSELREFVEKGGGLFLAVGDEVDPDRYNEELAELLPQPLHVVKTAAGRGGGQGNGAAARFEDIAWDHPAFSIFVGPAREGLEGVRTFRYMLLRPAEGAKVLASYDDGAPALVESRRGRGRVLLYTSSADREWTDWPIRTSFLPAVQRFAAWLAGGLEERKVAAAPVHAERTVEVAEGQRLVSLVDPAGRERAPSSLPRRGDPAGGSFTFRPDEPGLWQVKVEEGGGEKLDPALAFSVLPDPRESDTRRLDPSELTAWLGGEALAKVEGEAGGGGAERSLPLWSMLLALAVVAFLAEGALVAS